MAKKPKIKKKERMVKERERELSEKKEEAGNVSEQRDKGWIHVNPCTRYNPLSSDTNTAGQLPHTKKE